MGVDVAFYFDRLTTNSQIAIFRSNWSIESYREQIFALINDFSPDVLNDAKQIVQIRNHLHDIYIPDLKVDMASSEISFNWINLFSLFFAEEKAYDKLMQEWVSYQIP